MSLPLVAGCAHQKNLLLESTPEIKQLEPHAQGHEKDDMNLEDTWCAQSALDLITCARIFGILENHTLQT